jgi:hypothetical protein
MGSGRMPTLTPETRRMVIAAAIVLGLLAFLAASAAFWVNWWWFGSLGYRQVLTVRYLSEIGSFLVGATLAALFFALNWQLAVRNGQRMLLNRPAGPFGTSFGRWILRGLTLLTAFVAGSWAAERWETWQLVLRGGAFGVTEPVYGLDAGFYVFRLPALQALQAGAVGLLLWTAIVVVAIYVVSLGLERLDFQNPPVPARRHVLTLAGVFLVLVAGGYLLGAFGILFGQRGFVFGGGFTEVTVARPLRFVLAVASLAAAVIVFLNAWRMRTRGLLVAGGVWLAAVLIGLFLPAVVQQTVVEPNELSREAPYIANNIALTRAAYDLEDIDVLPLSGAGSPPASALTADSPTFDNVRLWDYRIVRDTFRQLRSFVPYYVFNDVDVDRYEIDGQLQQVLISARELNVEGLPANAQTWQNQHLAYTHGYGVVVSPISGATAQGLPRFLVGDIPPEGTGALAIERPELYFGEVVDNWVAVNTSFQEVSGLSGETEAQPYAGEARGSVRVSSYLHRLMLAFSLGDRRLLLSGELNTDSRVLLRRTLTDRAQAVAPFLLFDPDPYPVIADGRIVWIMDAYSATNRFPGASRVAAPGNTQLNYLRHTARMTVDAYDGTVTLYRTETPDPIADAYASIYPDLFTPIAEVPPAVAAHFRYPEAQFDVQSEVFGAYHVTDPGNFYNGEDRWVVAQEEIETDARGGTRTQPIEAYYMTLPLPGETDSSFKLVRPFTPNNRPNMTAWMAALTDDAGTAPRIVTYRFPRQSNIFGPQQVEARINQDPEISSQITLLDQAGSRVLRGNLLVIPVDESVLYVQPLYLQATGTQGAPTELQFVIVATQDEVEMRTTLEDALAAVAAAAPAGAGQANVEGTGEPGAPETVVVTGATAAEALAAYQRGQDALGENDWAAYGDAQEDLRAILEQLAGEQLQAGTPAAGLEAEAPVVPEGTPAP